MAATGGDCGDEEPEKGVDFFLQVGAHVFRQRLVRVAVRLFLAGKNQARRYARLVESAGKSPCSSTTPMLPSVELGVVTIALAADATQ